MRLAFRITPVLGAFVVDPRNSPTAQLLTDQVVQAASIADAHALAIHIHKETGQPVAIIDGADPLIEYDAEGRQIIPESPSSAG